MRILAVVVVTAACATTPQLRATAAPRIEESKPTPLDDVASNLVDAFSGWNVAFYAGAIAGTSVLALSGADHELHVRFHRHIENSAWNETANVAGYMLPLLSAPMIWTAGLATNDRTLIGAGSAALQALVITIATTGALKFTVGRPFPLLQDEEDHPDHAHSFSPFQNGIGSWPSGHTAGTISIAAALTAYAPEQRWIPFVGYPLAVGIGLGMVDRGSHWMSDLVSGTLIGHAIGYSVGKNFRKRVRGARTVPDSFEVVPFSGGAGIAVRGRW